MALRGLVDLIAVDPIAVDLIAVDLIAVDLIAVDLIAVDLIAVDLIAVDLIAVESVAVESVAVESVAVESVAVDSVPGVERKPPGAPAQVHTNERAERARWCEPAPVPRGGFRSTPGTESTATDSTQRPTPPYAVTMPRPFDLPAAALGAMLTVSAGVANPTPPQTLETDRFIGHLVDHFAHFGQYMAGNGQRVFIFDGEVQPGAPFGLPFYSVREYDGVEWREVDRINLAVSASGETLLPTSMAADDETLVCGSTLNYLPYGASGAVAVFDLRTPSGLASPQLLYSDFQQQGAGFGRSVALSGDVLVVGEPSARRADTGPYTGFVHVFQRSVTGAWVRVAKLTVSSATLCPSIFAGGSLGYSVAIDGDVIVASLPMGATTSPQFQTGRALVFERVAGQWIETACVTIPSPPQGSLSYSRTVAVDGNRFVLSEPRESAPGAGRVHVYERPGPGPGGWAYTATLTASNAFSGTAGTDLFGERLHLSGDELLVGAPLASPITNDPSRWHEGMAYRFVYANGQWTEVEQYWTNFAAQGNPGARFGERIHLGPDQVLVSGPNDKGAGGANAGAVYSYQRPIATSICPGTPNSASATGADLGLRGTRDHGRPALGFHLTGLPPSTSVLMLAAENGGQVVNPGGSQGTLCLGSPLGRLRTTAGTASPWGTYARALDLADPGVASALTAAAGRTWRFQAWYRDQNPSPTSNFSAAVAVTLR